MKKKFPLISSVVNSAVRMFESPSFGRTLFFVLALELGLGLVTLSQSQATLHLDQRFSLESIGFLKASDNVDGLFAELVANTYKEYFSHQSRFLINDLSKIDPLLNNPKIAYQKLILDPDILGQIARSSRSETLIRTTILKEGPRYYFTLEWLHAPQIELISRVTFTLEEPEDGSSLNGAFIFKAMSGPITQLIQQVPFLGMLTGRDHQIVTLNLGSQANLKKGDLITVGTLDEVKRHPLLKTIENWQIHETGKVVVEQTEENIAFCKIIEESSNQAIQGFQKIVHIQNEPLIDSSHDLPLKKSDSMELQEAPKFGWLGVQLLAGPYSRQSSSVSPSTSLSGGGTELGAKIIGELWLTPRWFTNAELGYGSYGFSQTDSTTGNQTPVSQNGGVTGSLTSLLIDGGYSYAFNQDFYGPKARLKLGFRSSAFSLPATATEQTGAISFSTFFLELEGDVPLEGNWGVLGHLNYGLLSLVSQNLFTDQVSGSSDIHFLVGGYYRVNSSMVIRAGLELHSTSADFTSGENISQKTVTIGPSLLYYF